MPKYCIKFESNDFPTTKEYLKVTEIGNLNSKLFLLAFDSQNVDGFVKDINIRWVRVSILPKLTT